ncbi:hypothetical protein Fcan01_24887 [Folsomia candida]|uniref:Uncharacterized protein n=1 Tax=Folsomia candida TaxID=158441 RepID=A0A226D3V2_FOLCA|nr:hypothetical protein Fcan01_24887 [Folsomia candida]
MKSILILVASLVVLVGAASPEVSSALKSVEQVQEAVRTLILSTLDSPLIKQQLDRASENLRNLLNRVTNNVLPEESQNVRDAIIEIQNSLTQIKNDLLNSIPTTTTAPINLFAISNVIQVASG